MTIWFGKSTKLRELYKQRSYLALGVTSVILKSAQSLSCLKCVLWPANVSLDIGVFKESQTGVGAAGCCQFSGGSAPWLGSRCEEREGLWEEVHCQGTPCWAQPTDRSHMAAPGCDEMLPGLCEHRSTISVGQPESQRCESNYVCWAWSNTLTLCEDLVQPKLLQALLCLLKCRVSFLQNQHLKISSCLKFMGYNWFLPFKSLKNLHPCLNFPNGVHLSLLHVCKPQAWWTSVPGISCSVANVEIKT